MHPPDLIDHVRHAAQRIRSIAPVRIRDGIGADLKMDLRQSHAWYGSGTNDMPVQQALATHLRLGDTFFDIGAHVGFFTLIAARLVGPTGHAVAFEPATPNAAAIRRNAAMNRFSNIRVVEAAVAAGEGGSDLTPMGHPCPTMRSSVETAHRRGRSITVATVSIDGLVEQGNLPPPTLVKIGVVGAERAILEGMRRVAERYQPAIICHGGSAPPAASEPREKALLETLALLGYRVENLLPHTHIAPRNSGAASQSVSPTGRHKMMHLLAIPASGDGQSESSGYPPNG